VVAITWIKPAGAEYASVRFGPGMLYASGMAVGASPVPYQLGYTLSCGDDYVTRDLSVHAHGEEWSRSLRLSRDKSGRWQVTADAEGEVDLPPPGGDPAAFAAALDCDLGECPVTNTMPVLRHRLLAGGEPVEFLMAWVSVPDLSVRASVQRYTFLRRAGDGAVVNYSAGAFSADVTFDAAGLVVDYPGMATRA
jgi:hypothetical protein